MASGWKPPQSEPMPTLTHGQWACRFMPPLIIWQYLSKLTVFSNPGLGNYTEDTLAQCKDFCTKLFRAALFDGKGLEAIPMLVRRNPLNKWWFTHAVGHPETTRKERELNQPTYGGYPGDIKWEKEDLKEFV